jgi:3-mercaptopyruvate sulfurtransferase SseA
VREPVECRHHIEGGFQIPGARAKLAAPTFKDMGFADVANLDGGLTAWTEAQLLVAEHHAGIA